MKNNTIKVFQTCCWSDPADNDEGNTDRPKA